MFDPETQTEQSYDYVRVFKDEDLTETWHPEEEKYHGQGGCGAVVLVVVLMRGRGAARWLQTQSLHLYACGCTTGSLLGA
jgi:hypothetical protein